MKKNDDTKIEQSAKETWMLQNEIEWPNSEIETQ